MTTGDTVGDPVGFGTIDEALTSANAARRANRGRPDTPATPLDTAGDTVGTAELPAAPGAGLSDHRATEGVEGGPEVEQAAEQAVEQPRTPGGNNGGGWRPESKNRPWEAVRRRYVEGYKDDAGIHQWPSLDMCGDHFGIPGKKVRVKSSKYGWVEQRRTFQAQVEATRRQARANMMAKSSTDLDGNALSAAQMGLQLCLAALGDLGRRIEEHRRQYLGNPDAPGLPVDALEQQRLAAAVELWHKVGLRAIGDPDVRLELTGAGGGPIEITQELRRDDPDRFGAVLAVLKLADLDGVIPGHVLAAASDDDDGRGDGQPAALEARR